jgi:hypothetical protein
MGALLNKWASVRQQQQEEEERKQRQLEQEQDLEYVEAMRRKELEQWSKQQMAAGAEDNPNFTPVVGDWRARLGLGGAAAGGAAGAAAETPEERAARKAAKRAAKAAKKATAVAAAAAAHSGGDDGSSQWPTSMKTKPDLQALSVGLPPGWVAMFEHDAATGVYNIYYGNPDTKASVPGVAGCLVRVVCGRATLFQGLQLWWVVVDPQGVVCAEVCATADAAWDILWARSPNAETGYSTDHGQDSLCTAWRDQHHVSPGTVCRTCCRSASVAS